MKKKRLALLLVLTLACLVLPACKQKLKTADKDKVELPKECKLSILESGYTYCKDDDSIYYAVVVKNESENYACSTPKVKLIAYDGNGEKIGTEVVTLPAINPGETVSYAAINSYTDTYPRSLEFKIKKDKGWAEFDKDEAATPLRIESYGKRTYVNEDVDEEKSDDNYDADFEDIDKLFDELDAEYGDEIESQAKAEAKSQESNDPDSYNLIDESEGTEYYGTIINENKKTYEEVLVCVIYRNRNGAIIGGENYTVRDVGEGRTTFSFVSASALDAASYEMFAYAW